MDDLRGGGRQRVGAHVAPGIDDDGERAVPVALRRDPAGDGIVGEHAQRAIDALRGLVAVRRDGGAAARCGPGAPPGARRAPRPVLDRRRRTPAAPGAPPRRRRPGGSRRSPRRPRRPGGGAPPTRPAPRARRRRASAGARRCTARSRAGCRSRTRASPGPRRGPGSRGASSPVTKRSRSDPPARSNVRSVRGAPSRSTTTARSLPTHARSTAPPARERGAPRRRAGPRRAPPRRWCAGWRDRGGPRSLRRRRPRRRRRAGGRCGPRRRWGARRWPRRRDRDRRPVAAVGHPAGATAGEGARGRDDALAAVLEEDGEGVAPGVELNRAAEIGADVAVRGAAVQREQGVAERGEGQRAAPVGGERAHQRRHPRAPRRRARRRHHHRAALERDAGPVEPVERSARVLRQGHDGVERAEEALGPEELPPLPEDVAGRGARGPGRRARPAVHLGLDGAHRGDRRAAQLQAPAVHHHALDPVVGALDRAPVGHHVPRRAHPRGRLDRGRRRRGRRRRPAPRRTRGRARPAPAWRPSTAR